MTWNETQEQVKGFPSALHKSFFSFEEAKDWLENKEEKIIAPVNTIYTDGSCQKQKGGWAYVVVEDGEIITERSGFIDEYPTTNNRAELTAILRVLQDFPHQDLLISPDSQYAINAISVW